MIAVPSLPVWSSGARHPAGVDLALVAREWARLGFRRMRVPVCESASDDRLDAAVIDGILRDGAPEGLVGGDLRSADLIDRLLDAGACQIVVGARALDEPDWLAGLAIANPHLVVLETDVRNRRVVNRGRARTLPVDVLDLVHELSTLPLGGLLLDSVALQGHDRHADLSLVEDAVDVAACPIFVRGAFTSLDDMHALEHRGAAAVIVDFDTLELLDARSVAAEFGD
jgi:phosphoribosylformimino-5-aminoimidazole carboxamide ribonucleotide (ProFAR) isomerase